MNGDVSWERRSSKSVQGGERGRVGWVAARDKSLGVDGIGEKRILKASGSAGVRGEGDEGREGGGAGGQWDVLE